MRRIKQMVTVVVLMVAILAAGVSPAAAAPDPGKEECNALKEQIKAGVFTEFNKLGRCHQFVS
jgi:hypothetical protein